MIAARYRVSSGTGAFWNMDNPAGTLPRMEFAFEQLLQRRAYVCLNPLGESWSCYHRQWYS